VLKIGLLASVVWAQLRLLTRSIIAWRRVGGLWRDSQLNVMNAAWAHDARGSRGERPNAAYEMLDVQGSFDCAAASIRVAATSLKMTVFLLWDGLLWDVLDRTLEQNVL